MRYIYDIWFDLEWLENNFKIYREEIEEIL